MEKGKIKIEVGKRVLYHVAGGKDILEGVISDVSPSGELFKINGNWFCEGSMYSHGEATRAEILDVLDGKPREPERDEEEDSEFSWQREIDRARRRRFG